MDAHIISAIVVLFAIVIWVVLTAKRSAKSGKAKIYRVLDGDTAIVKQGLRKYTIRLDAIDCPESDQIWGDTSTAGLIKLVGGKSVKLQVYGGDHYGRSLATIYVWDEKKSDWLNVNERMLLLGHAWLYRQHLEHLPQEKKDEMSRMENWARTKRVGLWRSANPIPPWEWRQRNKSRRRRYRSSNVVRIRTR